MDLQGTRTRENLMKAFEGESKAAMKYFLFADEAEEEGVESIFEETMKNETEHAEIFAEYLGIIGDTVYNLQSAIVNESLESNIDYPEFAKIARIEGFPEIAEKFELVSKVEDMHKDRFGRLLKEIENGTLLKKSKSHTWICTKCGNVHEGLKPPVECPLCGHDADDYILKIDYL